MIDKVPRHQHSCDQRTGQLRRVWRHRKSYVSKTKQRKQQDLWLMTIHDVTCSARRHEHITFTQTGQNRGLSRAVVLFLFCCLFMCHCSCTDPAEPAGGDTALRNAQRSRQGRCCRLVTVQHMLRASHTPATTRWQVKMMKTSNNNINKSNISP